ncbi:MAG: hypothetical protein AB1817_18900 [Chloroflexota bacterium]
MYAQEPVNVNLRNLLVVMVIFIVGGAWFLGAVANEDALWFMPYFDETPSRIVVYRAGCRAEILPGRPGFAELTAALNQTLSQVDGYEQGFGLSPETLQGYIARGYALEISYPTRIRIHTPYRFGAPDTLFIPLDGHFGGTRAVFGGHRGEYWASALRLKTVEPIRHAAEQIHCP